MPQPEVHIRGDENARYEFVGRVVFACQRAGIQKVGFITEPPRAATRRDRKEYCHGNERGTAADRATPR